MARFAYYQWKTDLNQFHLVPGYCLPTFCIHADRYRHHSNFESKCSFFAVPEPNLRHELVQLALYMSDYLPPDHMDECHVAEAIAQESEGLGRRK